MEECFRALGTEPHLLVCLFACLLVCLFACLLVCLFACLLVCLFACLLVCLFACLLDCLFARPILVRIPQQAFLFAFYDSLSDVRCEFLVGMQSIVGLKCPVLLCPRSVKVFRSQLSRSNPFYSYHPHSDAAELLPVPNAGRELRQHWKAVLGVSMCGEV